MNSLTDWLNWAKVNLTKEDRDLVNQMVWDYKEQIANVVKNASPGTLVGTEALQQPESGIAKRWEYSFQLKK